MSFSNILFKVLEYHFKLWALRIWQLQLLSVWSPSSHNRLTCGRIDLLSVTKHGTFPTHIVPSFLHICCSFTGDIPTCYTATPSLSASTYLRFSIFEFHIKKRSLITVNHLSNQTNNGDADTTAQIDPDILFLLLLVSLLLSLQLGR